MRRKRREDDELDEQPRQRRRGPDRSWSTRIAWLALFGGAALVLTRVSVASVVVVHGDGMAPTIVSGDHVLFVRGSWGLARGDVVVYDPTPAPVPPPERSAPDDIPDNYDDLNGHPDPAREANAELRNTAVVDVDELEHNWDKVQRRSGATEGQRPSGYRVARILAVPGDEVTFHVPEAPLGVAVNGSPLHHKPREPVRIALRSSGADAPATPVRREAAYESVADRRYVVLSSSAKGPEGWNAMAIPDAAGGPVQTRAAGYLVVADNRDEGACCDSRAIGWVPADHIRGEIMLRLPGDPTVTPDLDPTTRGSRWEP